MSGVLSKLSLLSSLTVASRFLGLARDVLLFSAFGASIFGEAFILAFTLPNLFRRMLGEGTLSSAFIPVYSTTLKSKSLVAALDLFNRLSARLAIGLISLTALVCLGSLFLAEFAAPGKWTYAVKLNSVSFWYLSFICLSAIAIGALNTHGSFFAGGASPIILNLSMIFSLSFFGIWMAVPLKDLALIMCATVVVAGILQLSLPLLQMKSKLHWKFTLNLKGSAELSRINQIFWIGALGAAVVQINILVSRFFAYSLDETGSLSYLFISSRLIELPLGVFAISIATVLFPELSKTAMLDDRKPFEKRFFQGLRLTMAVTLPAAAGLSILAHPIISLLFDWGMFDGKNVERAGEVLAVSAFGLPFFALSTFLVKSFHSEQNMKIPMQAAVVSVVANFILCLSMLEEFGVIGLAYANVIAAILQTSYLWFKRKETNLRQLLQFHSLQTPNIVISTFLMSLLLLYLLEIVPDTPSKAGQMASVGSMVFGGVLIYGTILWGLGLQELRNALKFIKKK